MTDSSIEGTTTRESRPCCTRCPTWRRPSRCTPRCSARHRAGPPYYVGFEAEGQHIGLVPAGGPQGMTSPVAYWHVSDIEAKLAEVTAAGAAVKESPRDVGGGRLVATVTDLDGNVLGLMQDLSGPRRPRGRTRRLRRTLPTATT